MRRAKGRCCAAVIATLVMVAGLLVGQVSQSTTAAANSGLVRVTSGPTPENSDLRKSKRARCPTGFRVVGGGGWAYDHGHGMVALTAVVPGRDRVLRRDYFQATASEPSTGFSAGWWLEAYALCAPAASLPGYQQVSATSTNTNFVTARAKCPAGKRIFGTGASVSPDDHAGLQLFRSTGPRDAAVATARSRGEYFGNIKLHAFGICTTAPAVTVATVRNQDNAAADCPSGMRAHGVAGGGSPTDSGNSFLQDVYPPSQLHRARAAMTATPNGGMVTQAICAR